MPHPDARARLVGPLALLAFIGCASDPPPPPPPAATPPPPAQNGAARAGTRPGPGAQDPREVRVSRATFSPEVMELKEGDLVAVDLVTGSTRGKVVGIKPRELALASEGTSIVTRLTPEEVREVRVLYRAPAAMAFTVVVSTQDDPRNDEEAWLDRYADLAVLGGAAPAELWSQRFARNVPLVVARPFTMPGLTFAAREKDRRYFVADAQPTPLQPEDQVKLVAISRGHRQVAGGEDVSLGEVYLYLVQRERRVTPLYSTGLMVPSNLDPASVRRFLEEEPVTLALARPGPPVDYRKVQRVPARVVRSYHDHLARIPARVEVRRLRARDSRDPELKKIEQRIEQLYRAVGFKEPQDLEHPLLFEFRLPTGEGTLRMPLVRQEIALD